MKKRMVKTISFFLLVGAAALSMAPPPTPAFAESASAVQKKLDQATKDKKANLDKLNEAKSQKQSALAEKAVLDHEIDLIQSELNEIDTIIADADQKIAEKEQEISQYEDEITQNDALFRQRLRAMDEINVSSYIDVLLKADNFSDFLARIETIREITENDQGIINKMVELRNGVVLSKQEIEASRQEQVDARGMVDEKKQSLDAKMAEKTAFINSIASDAEKYQQLADEAEASEAQLKKDLAKALSTPKPAQTGGSNGGGSVPYSGGGGSGALMWPLPSSRNITSPFGYRTHPIYGTTKYHSGLDISGSMGAPVYAAAGGTVLSAGWNGGYGNCVVIDHGGGLSTLYGHNSSLLVSSGQSVSKGQQIAKVGSTGNSTGPHLHFEVMVNGSVVNPNNYVN